MRELRVSVIGDRQDSDYNVERVLETLLVNGSIPVRNNNNPDLFIFSGVFADSVYTQVVRIFSDVNFSGHVVISSFTNKVFRDLLKDRIDEGRLLLVDMDSVEAGSQIQEFFKAKEEQK